MAIEERSEIRGVRLEKLLTNHTVRAASRVDRDWTVFSGEYRPLSGRVSVQLVYPSFGGGGIVLDRMRYDLVYPPDVPAAVRLIRSYSQHDAAQTVTVRSLTGCLEDVQRMKAPQVKTVIRKVLDLLEGRLLTVNCTVSASGASVSVEERVPGSPYWK